jgi:hypothetical protein
MAAVNANPLGVITRVIRGRFDRAKRVEKHSTWRVRRWGSADGHPVPWAGTNVQCTWPRERRMFGLSSSVGGLFGRPVTLRSLGRFLFLGSSLGSRFASLGLARSRDPSPRRAIEAIRMENPRGRCPPG